jgi:Response regulator receiver domain
MAQRVDITEMPRRPKFGGKRTLRGHYRWAFPPRWNQSSLLNILSSRAFARGGGVSELPLILVIEDEYFLQADLEKALTEAGFATDIVSSGEEALTLLMGGLKRPRALVTDVKLKGRLSGWEVARRIREKDPSFPIIYVTAYHREWPSESVPNS